MDRKRQTLGQLLAIRPAATPVAVWSLPTLYIRNACPACAAAVAFLESNGIGFREANISHDRVALVELQRKADAAKTPTLDWHGTVLAGFDFDALREFLDQRNVLLVQL